MRDLIIEPSVLNAVKTWLIEQDELVDFSDPRPIVVSQLPATKTDFMIRATQFNDIPVTRAPRWFGSTFIQFDVYGGPTKRAEQLARLCMALLNDRFPGEHDDVLVSTVNVNGLRDEPDTTFDSARPRWLFVAEIFTRPISSVGS